MNATTKKPKTRLAGEADRRIAREWVELFESQEPVIVCAGPNGEEQYRPVDAHDLACVLQMFAERGTFRASPEAHRLVRGLMVNDLFAKLRASGDTYEVAVEKCAEQHKCSETTIRQSLSRRNRISLVKAH